MMSGSIAGGDHLPTKSYVEAVTRASRRWMPPGREGQSFREMSLVEQNETIAFMLGSLIRAYEIGRDEGAD